jgi:hypothetical protein
MMNYDTMGHATNLAADATVAMLDQQRGPDRHVSAECQEHILANHEVFRITSLEGALMSDE